MPYKKKKLPSKEAAKAEASQTVQQLDQTEAEAAVKEKIPVEIQEWVPKTMIERAVKEGKIKSIDEILDRGIKITAPQIVDVLLPNLKTELLLIGQAKGKFGGGQRRIFRQVQKKTAEGNKPRFEAAAVVGNEDGYVGIGYGKSKETVPAREKAIKNAKLSLFKISRGCGSWECGCREPHTIPFSIKGKCGSVIISLMPAPKGTGLKIESEGAKILRLAGISDIWSKTFGKTRTKLNFIKALENALRSLTRVKLRSEWAKKAGVNEGAVNA